MRVRWDFAAGPAQDLQVFRGAWQWKRNAEKSSGCMWIAPKVQADVLLPTLVPAHPFLVTAKFRQARDGNLDHSGTGANWNSDQRQLPYKKWTKFWNAPPQGPFELRVFFIGRYVVQKFFSPEDEEGFTVHVYEHAEAYPSDRVSAWFENMEVDEIELRALGREELSASLSNPRRLTVDMGEPEEIK